MRFEIIYEYEQEELKTYIDMFVLLFIITDPIRLLWDYTAFEVWALLSNGLGRIKIVT